MDTLASRKHGQGDATPDADRGWPGALATLAISLSFILPLLGCEAQPVELDSEGAITIPAAVDATGAVDVTDVLNSIIAAVPDSATLQFAKNGRYRVDGTLIIRDKRLFTIDGNGSTVVALTHGGSRVPPPFLAHKWPRGRRHILILGGAHISIRHLTIVGSNPAAGTGLEAYNPSFEAQHAFDIQGASDVTLEKVGARDIWGDFVYLGANERRWATRIRVRDSHFERNGRQGIAITAAEDVIIERNYFGATRRASIDIEPNDHHGGARHVIVRDNRFGPGRLLFLASGGAPGMVADVEIRDNYLIGRPLSILVGPPAGSRRGPLRIVNNISTGFYGSSTSLMWFTNIDGLEIAGNYQRFVAVREMTGAIVKASCNVTFANNVFVDAAVPIRLDPFDC